MNGPRVYKFSGFSLGTVGPRGAPELVGPKAAETGSLLRYTVELLQKHHREVTHGQALLTCGQALVKYLNITRSAGDILKPQQQQQLMDSALCFLGHRHAAGIAWIQKMHLMIHLVKQSDRHGNPYRLATWTDESLNRELASVCGSAHPLVFERRVLSTFNAVDGPIATSAKRRRL